MTRLLEALKWLAAEVSADRDEFRAKFKQGADDLRDGLVAHGLARYGRKVDRWAVSEAGGRMLDAEAAVDG